MKKLVTTLVVLSIVPVFLLAVTGVQANSGSLFGSNGLFGLGGIFGHIATNSATGPATPSASLRDRLFKATLTGSAEVPPVATSSATGKGRFKINKLATEIDFKLKVKDGVGVTEAHLHCGLSGVSGPIVAYLFGNVPGGFNVDGTLAEFTLTNANIVPNSCSPAISNISDLINAIRAGRIYANVHTVAHPTGEIRGQLVH